jgi:hypothetical protein
MAMFFLLIDAIIREIRELGTQDLDGRGTIPLS